MRMNRAWDSFWGALGLVRRNRRQRQAAAKRRNMRHRPRMEALEQRVVLNADPIAGDDEYVVSPYVETATSNYAPDVSNDFDNDSDPLGVSLDANPNRNVTLNPGDSYSWTYVTADGRGGSDSGRVQITAEGTPTSPPRPMWKARACARTAVCSR
ncbi:MAG: Ig-like domain-containing protein [Pirellulales bacterium]